MKKRTESRSSPVLYGFAFTILAVSMGLWARALADIAPWKSWDHLPPPLLSDQFTYRDASLTDPFFTDWVHIPHASAHFREGMGDVYVVRPSRTRGESEPYVLEIDTDIEEVSAPASEAKEPVRYVNAYVTQPESAPEEDTRTSSIVTPDYSDEEERLKRAARRAADGGEPAATRSIDTERTQELQKHSAAPVEELSPAEEVISVPEPSSVSDEELKQWEVAYGYSISIPAINVSAPVYVPSMTHWQSKAWDMLEEQMRFALTKGATTYPHSAAPGKNGAVIIAGHSSPPDALAEESSFGHLFARLPELTEGDLIHVGGRTYSVKKSYVVEPTETTILKQPEGESMLRLITCFPVGTTRQRLIIEATLLENI